MTSGSGWRRCGLPPSRSGWRSASAGGQHAELVAELTDLVARHPLREHLHGQLMVALYRSGRQADALAAYQRARHTLNEQLGLDPSPQLRALEEAMLRHDSSLTAPQPTHAPAPGPGTPSPASVGTPTQQASPQEPSRQDQPSQDQPPRNQAPQQHSGAPVRLTSFVGQDREQRAG